MIRLYTPASLTLVPMLLLTIYTSVAFFSESLGWALLCTTTDSYIRDISCSPQTTQSCRGPAVDAQYRRCAIPAPSRLFTTFDWSAPAQGHACVINVCSYFATDRKLQQESQQTMQSKEVTGMVPCPYPIFPPTHIGVPLSTGVLVIVFWNLGPTQRSKRRGVESFGYR